MILKISFAKLLIEKWNQVYFLKMIYINFKKFSLAFKFFLNESINYFDNLISIWLILKISFAKLEKWNQVYFLKMIYINFKKFSLAFKFLFNESINYFDNLISIRLILKIYQNLSISFAKLEKWNQIYFLKMIYIQFKMFYHSNFYLMN